MARINVPTDYANPTMVDWEKTKYEPPVEGEEEEKDSGNQNITSTPDYQYEKFSYNPGGYGGSQGLDWGAVMRNSENAGYASQTINNPSMDTADNLGYQPAPNMGEGYFDSSGNWVNSDDQPVYRNNFNNNTMLG